MRPLASVAGLALLLAACGEESVDTAADDNGLTTVAEPGDQTALPSAPEPVGPVPEDMAVLESRDCAAVVQGFAGALHRKAFTFAELFWMPDAEGKAGFDSLVQGMASPVLTVDAMTQEGAAGSLFCTVEVSLADASAPPADPTAKPTQATLVLRRVNDVDGATPQQLRWTIRSYATGPY